MGLMWKGEKMEYEIGMTAGKVYQFLSSNGPATIAQIKKGVKDAKGALVDMAIGWLAREDKLCFEAKGKGVLLSLK
jgi:hypothetical protein